MRINTENKWTHSESYESQMNAQYLIADLNKVRNKHLSLLKAPKNHNKCQQIYNNLQRSFFFAEEKVFFAVISTHWISLSSSIRWSAWSTFRLRKQKILCTAKKYFYLVLKRFYLAVMFRTIKLFAGIFLLFIHYRLFFLWWG